MDIFVRMLNLVKDNLYSSSIFNLNFVKKISYDSNLLQMVIDLSNPKYLYALMLYSTIGLPRKTHECPLLQILRKKNRFSIHTKRKNWVSYCLAEIKGVVAMNCWHNTWVVAVKISNKKAFVSFCRLLFRIA